MDVKNSQRVPPFTVFEIVGFFKMNIFVFKLGFFRPSSLYPHFYFLKIGVFSMRLFSKLFSSKPLLNFSLETKRFANIKDSSVFSALCDLPEIFIKKIQKISKIFSSFFCFWKGFRLIKMGLFSFPLGKMVFESYAFFSGIFLVL